MVLIRIWLCSASRVRQPNRPVSGIPASPAVNRRILASFRLPASRAFAVSDAVVAARCPRSPMPPAPGLWPPAPRETHLAKKTLQMRLPNSSHRRNQQKKNGLQRHE